jgi:hypothetical protein
VSFDDRFALFFSRGRRIDGLWVGRFLGDPQSLDRVEEALRLIKAHDPIRYARLLRDLDRIWVTLLSGDLGGFSDALRACKLDERFVLAEASQPEAIASVIVHESTHARLAHCGIGYKGEEFRARVEKVCFRRELAFGAKLPNGAEVRAQADRRLGGYRTTFWTDAAFEERFQKGSAEALRYLNQPEWFIRLLLASRRIRLRCVRLARRLAGSSGA